MRPVILIPGLGGSILVRKGHEFYKPHPLAPQKVIHNRWVNIQSLTSPPSRQWREDMAYTVRKQVDDNGRETVVGFGDVPHHIIPYDIGSTRGIKDLVPEFAYFNNGYKDKLNALFYYRYFNCLCESLYKCGYEDNATLYGVPYDFRLVLDPKYREKLFSAFGSILTKSVNLTGEKAVVVSHSLGGLLFKWFLTATPYYQTMVEHWISVSTPYGGSHYSLRAALCGDHYVPFFKTTVKAELSRCSGIIMCFPNEISFEKDETIAYIDDEETVPLNLKSYDKLAEKGIVQFQIWRDLYKPYLHLIEMPVGVPMTGVISTSNPTKGIFSMKEFGELPCTIEKVPGDGIIVQKSLESFKNMVHSSLVNDLIIPEGDHTSLLMHPEVLKLVKHHALSPSRRHGRKNVT